MTSALPPDSFYGLGFRIFYRARIALSNPFYVWNTACAFHGSHFNFILPRKLNSLSFVWNIHNDICFTGVKIFEGRLASLVPLRIFICHEIITLGKLYLNCVSSWLLCWMKTYSLTVMHTWRRECGLIAWPCLYAWVFIFSISYFMSIWFSHWKCWRHEWSNKSYVKLIIMYMKIEGSWVWIQLWRYSSVEGFEV